MEIITTIAAKLQITPAVSRSIVTCQRTTGQRLDKHPAYTHVTMEQWGYAARFWATAL
jgi:sulfite reductase beta subunit-like hemoprotein